MHEKQAGTLAISPLQPHWVGGDCSSAYLRLYRHFIGNHMVCNCIDYPPFACSEMQSFKLGRHTGIDDSGGRKLMFGCEDFVQELNRRVSK